MEASRRADPYGQGAPVRGVGAGSTSAGSTSSSQRTLTVIVNFDANNDVRDFSYHSSRF
ncbi:MAG: hypothetical protein IIA12_04430 [Proteobacteria bacterium]|nr:hypothetical protein [Pseudomonadota bacterium]